MTHRPGARTSSEDPIGYVDRSSNDPVAQQLGREALHDPLTDLANRRAFEDAVRTAPTGDVVLSAELLRVEPAEAATIPHFDEMVLLTVGARLRAAIGPHDLAARIGPSDLTVLLHDVSDDDLDQRVAAISAELLRPVEVDGLLVQIGATIGTTRLHGDDDPDDVLGRARQNVHRGTHPDRDADPR
jgi:diguanylate cyclase